MCTKKITRLAGLICVLTLFPACGIRIDIAGIGGPSAAEQTLEAIYVQQTVEALQAPLTPPEEVPTEPTATREIIHTTKPSGPGWVSQWWMDTNSSSTAAQKRAAGGDFYNQNLLERPFTAQEMDYRPDVDLVRVELSQDANFYYFILHLSGVNPATNALSGFYGVEIDLNRNGRGDYLLWAQADGRSEWNIDNVFIYTDSNDDVGGLRPLLSDAPGHSGDSYDRLVFSPDHLDDPDMGWKRTDPADASVIQLAIKKSVLGGASTFMWSGWADDGIKDPTRFDYNDFFTLGEAGSPIGGAADYPLKAVYLVDNTCRLAYGFDPSGNEPGLCLVPEPTPTSRPEPTHTPRPQSCDCTDSQSLNRSQYCCELCLYYWTGDYCTLP